MFKKLLAMAFLIVGCSQVQAALQIEITGGINAGHKIAVAPFNQPSGLNTDVASVVSADLMRSGKFSLIPTSSIPQGSVVNGTVNVDVAATSGAEIIIVGNVTPNANKYSVEFQVVGLQGGNKGKVLAHYRGDAPASLLRQASQSKRTE